MERKILLASRHEELRAALRRDLRPGFKIKWIHAHADLLLEILEHDYDAIIYDLEISNGNGEKIVKIIKKIRPKVKLIVLSDDPSTELGGRILQQGVAYYGVKPVSTESIKQVLLSRRT